MLNSGAPGHSIYLACRALLVMGRRYSRPALLAILIIGAVNLLTSTAMSDEPENMDMRLRRLMKVDVIDEGIALKLAEMVLKHTYGQSNVEGQLPLIATDQGDRWRIEGSKWVPFTQYVDNSMVERSRIVIRKSDCRIVELTKIIVQREP
jgi:hypothetical protein